LLHGLRRRWFAALTLGGALAAVAAVAAWYLMSPKYTAVSQLKVLALPPAIIPDPLVSREEFKTYMRTMSQELRNRLVLRDALKQDKVLQLKLDDRESDPVAFVDEALKVEFLENSEILTVTLASQDPNVSLVLLKAVVDSFKKLILQAEEERRRQHAEDLDKVFRKARNELEVLKKGYEHDAALSKGVVDAKTLPFQQYDDFSQLNQARRDRDAAKHNLLTAQANLEAYIEYAQSLQKSKLSGATYDAAADADMEVKRLQDAIRAKERLVRELGGSLFPSGEAEARKLRNLKADLEKRRQEVREELKTRALASMEDNQELERRKLEVQIASFKQQHAQLETVVKDLEEKVKEYGKIDPRLEQLLSEIKAQTNLVETVGSRRDRERLELDAGPRVLVPSEPDLQRKDMRKQIAVTVVAPVLALLAACAGIAWLECRQRRVRSANHVAQGLGIPVVGAVPNLPNLERHLVGPAGETDLEGHPVMESIDSLRTLLLCDAATESTRVLLVTSAGPGEGKTTLASHLAGSLARAGRKTLLIDGDLRTPAAHQLFELPQQPGFSEVLLGEVEAAEAVLATPIDGLALMAAGQWDREVMQALARDGMQGIFEKLLEEFDFLVIDSHPVMAATDALLIGQRSDAVIVSVLREVSRAPQVYGACQRLAALGIRVLGAVVNGTDPEEVIEPPAPAAALAG
jgi:capsular exopolysaccharide synthesis family protein